jgi:hypothetical protein
MVSYPLGPWLWGGWCMVLAAALSLVAAIDLWVAAPPHQRMAWHWLLYAVVTLGLHAWLWQAWRQTPKGLLHWVALSNDEPAHWLWQPAGQPEFDKVRRVQVVLRTRHWLGVCLTCEHQTPVVAWAHASGQPALRWQALGRALHAGALDMS